MRSDLSAVIAPEYRLRVEHVQDREFLSRLYKSTREEEMNMVTNWSDQQKAIFLEQQFAAQYTFYQDQFANAHFWIIERDGRPIGRLYLDERVDELRIIDIAVIPQAREKGLGTMLMRGIMEEASGKDLCVRIHVEKNNRALRLYERLRFKIIEDKGVYFLMEWKPPA